MTTHHDGGELQASDEALHELRWDTFESQAGQLYTLHGSSGEAGFVIEDVDGSAQAFLLSGSEGREALEVSPVTDVDTAVDALEGAYAARQHERGLV